MASCIVPGRLLDGRDTVEIVLDHPAAIRPRVAAGENDDSGENDDWRLAAAFYPPGLVCA